MSKNTTSANVIGRVRGPRGIRGPVEKAKDRKGTLKRIWRYMEKQKWALILSVIFVFISTLLGLAAPYLIGVIIDDYIIPKDVSGAIRFILLLAIIYCTSVLFTWLQTFMMVRVSLQKIRHLRQDLFNKFQTLSLKFFDKHSHGDLMSRVTNDIDSLNSALSQSVIQILSTILMATGVTIAMFSLNWVLAIVTLLVIPLMMVTTKRIIKYSSSFYIKRQRDIGELNGFVEESISGNDVITLFGKEEQVYQKFSETNERLRYSAMNAEMVSGFMGPTN